MWLVRWALLPYAVVGLVGAPVPRLRGDSARRRASSDASGTGPPARAALAAPRAARAALAASVTRVAASSAAFACVAARPTSAFLWHPLLAGLALPLTTLGAAVVRSRARAAAAAAKRKVSGPDRKQLLVDRIKLHFYCSAAATWCLLLGTSAVVAAKAAAARKHLVSAHARLGAAAVLAWLGALLAAETNVWKDGPPWRAAPRFLWSDKTHRRLGTAANVLLLAAVASGVAWTGYGAGLGRRRTVALGAISVVLALDLRALSTPLAAAGRARAGRRLPPTKQA